MEIILKDQKDLTVENIMNAGLFENLQEGILIANVKREIIAWNRAAEIITDLYADEVVGKFCNIGPFKHINVKGHVTCDRGCPLIHCMRKAGIVKERIFITDAKKEMVPIVANTIPVKDSNNNVIGAVQLFTIDLEKENFKNTYEKVKEKIDEYRAIIIDLVNKNKQLNKSLVDLSNTDSLTKLYNRRYFYEEAERQFDISKNYNYSLSVIILDIDFFKKINDEYGHSAGDKILVEVSQILNEFKGSKDVLCRYGGEEFLLLLPDKSSNEAYLSAEILRSKIEDTEFIYNNTKIPVTISLGIASNELNLNLTLDHLVDNADKALYTAKHDGRNKSVIYYE